MNPFIITTPRTGSTLICKLLNNVAKQKFGHVDVLYEYFGVQAFRRYDYGIVDGTIKCVRNEFVNGKWWRDQNHKNEIIQHRIDMLAINDKYTIKAFPTELTPAVYNFVKQRYDLIYLERKDKLAQFLSFAAIWSLKKTHYKKDDTDQISSFMFDPMSVKVFFGEMQPYKAIKEKKQGITIFYEDFINEGGNQQALIKLLGLVGCDDLADCDITTKPTPYVNQNLEDAIINQSQWLIHKQEVLEKLRQHT